MRVMGRVILVSVVSILLFTPVCLARTWPVPSAECPTIQAGIDSASVGDTVLVAAGTYTGVGNRNLDFGGTDLVLLSEDGPELTIIDCQRSGGGIYFHSGETGAAVVEGFTITNGLGLGDPYGGGGMYCYNGSSPTVRNCTFYGNRASRGGGMSCWNSSPTVSNCTFSQNQGADGGGMLCGHSSPTVSDCEFSENEASAGGGMCCYDSSSPTVSNCSFVSNSACEGGGGIFCHNSSPAVSNCNFVDNAAFCTFLGGGGMCCYDSSPTVSNCGFVGNSAHNGGAMSCDGHNGGSSPTVSNCTFYGNSASSGAGVYCTSLLGESHPTLQNTIIAFSPDGEAVWCESGSGVTLMCCDVFGNTGGDWVGCVADQYGINGNFSACPSFCHTELGDFHLCNESPCLPRNHPDGYDCGLIGAFGEGCVCGPTQTQVTTWGAVKAMHR